MFRKGLDLRSRGLVVFGFFVPVLVIVALALLPAGRANACDEGDGTGFMIQAPLDAAPNCTATPATISVLGQTIDITEATFGQEDRHHGALSCSDLQSGQVVNVTMVSDATPLTATTVRSMDEDDRSVVIVSGLLQAVSTTKNTVRLLGITVDVSKAALKSDNDQTPALSQLQVGQFVLLTLSSNTAPFSGTTLFFHLVEVMVEAPLDSAPNCTASLPTISVLGLTIDISKAGLNKEGHGGGTFACTDLSAGQTVKVILAGDTAPPAATRVVIGERDWRCDEWGDVKISAPLVSITTSTSTPATTTVTVLETLTVDITNAILVAGWDQTITVQDLMVGEFVKMLLPSNTPPLTAQVVAVQTPASEVEFQVFDQKLHHVDDGDARDVSAAVTIVKAMNKTVTLHTTSSGDFRVANMPSGQAKVVVTRLNGGKKSRAANLVQVKGNTKSVGIILKPVSR
jgi:hypothetical protein